jgi:hypothetical protein
MIDTFFAGSAASAATALLGLGQRLTPEEAAALERSSTRPWSASHDLDPARLPAGQVQPGGRRRPGLRALPGPASGRAVDILRATVCLLLALPVIMNVLPAMDLALLPPPPPRSRRRRRAGRRRRGRRARLPWPAVRLVGGLWLLGFVAVAGRLLLGLRTLSRWTRQADRGDLRRLAGAAGTPVARRPPRPGVQRPDRQPAQLGRRARLHPGRSGQPGPAPRRPGHPGPRDGPPAPPRLDLPGPVPAGPGDVLVQPAGLAPARRARRTLGGSRRRRRDPDRRSHPLRQGP